MTRATVIRSHWFVGRLLLTTSHLGALSVLSLLRLARYLALGQMLPLQCILLLSVGGWLLLLLHCEHSTHGLLQCSSICSRTGITLCCQLWVEETGHEHLIDELLLLIRDSSHGCRCTQERSRLEVERARLELSQLWILLKLCGCHRLGLRCLGPRSN